MTNVGVMLGQRITYALAGKVHADYQTLADLVYGELLRIAREHEPGDWIELPNGTTYTMTFKPEESR